jgi:hypothetical protein
MSKDFMTLLDKVYDAEHLHRLVVDEVYLIAATKAWS